MASARFVQGYTLDALSTLAPRPIVAKRAPTSSDINYPIGQLWIEPVSAAGLTVNSAWILVSVINNAAQWNLIEASGAAGVFTSLTVTPGPISLTGTTGINTSGAGVTTINTGGTGALNLGNATGNTAVTGSLSTTTSLSATTTVTAGTGITATTGNIAASAGNVSASGTVTGGTGVVATTGNVSATAGAVNAGTSMTATLGNITATNGNLVMGTLGNKLVIPAGTNASIGTSVAMTTGSVTISTTAVTAASKIFLTRNTVGGTLGNLSVPSASIVANTSFVINSDSGTDTSTVNWLIIN